MSSCKDIHMPTIAIISQKGGAGKTTLALHLAAAAEDSGHTALVIDLDPPAPASQWAAWRQDVPPVVIDSAPPRLAAKIEQATAQGAEFIVIDTAPCRQRRQRRRRGCRPGADPMSAERVRPGRDQDDRQPCEDARQARFRDLHG